MMQQRFESMVSTFNALPETPLLLLSQSPNPPWPTSPPPNEPPTLRIEIAWYKYASAVRPSTP